MARQATTPLQFPRTVRRDEGVLMSSGRAGVVVPVGYIPLLRGDSASGRIAVDMRLAEMPRPLLNAVVANVQAWFVPKVALPWFSGVDEFFFSYMGEKMPVLKGGAKVETDPAAFFQVADALQTTAFAASDFAKTLGVHLPSGAVVNSDLVDSFVSTYNFRLRAHSDRLALKKFFKEDPARATELPRAFWPMHRFSRVVPDYERALLVGALDLDVSAGTVPIQGWAVKSPATPDWNYGGNVANKGSAWPLGMIEGQNLAAVFGGERVVTSLADIDMGRKTQAFAKIRQSMMGNDPNGFVSDDMIVAHLMQGLIVPEAMFRRPWLLDSKRIPFGFAERFSTTADKLDQSVTTGQVSAQLSINVPVNQYGGMIVVTAEVLPERIFERQGDPFFTMSKPDDLPDALRDSQNPEPVDNVLCSRLDAKHTGASSLYGYEPLNDKWNRAFTRLGGAFYQATPGTPQTEQRQAIWQAEVVNPTFTQDHYLAPSNFPHYVFADAQKPAFEFVSRHAVSIMGLTVIGDPLYENADNYAEVKP